MNSQLQRTVLDMLIRFAWVFLFLICSWTDHLHLNIPQQDELFHCKPYKLDLYFLYVNQLPRQSSISKRVEPCESASMTDIGTRRIFSEDHDIFRQTVRRFFQEEIAPYQAQ